MNGTMSNPFAFVGDIASWPFMTEPLWRWALFFGAMMGVAWGWHGLLDLMH